MIARLSGKLIAKQPNLVLIDVAGVGYEVNIPLSTFYELDNVGATISLNIHTHVREDVLQLFGFTSTREKDLFLKLTSVSGIGPRLAIAILSGIPAAELISAIRSDDLPRLVSIPGVGRKTAERLVVELRDKVAALSAPELDAEGAPPVPGEEGGEVRADTVAALVALGYQKPVAERAVIDAMREEGERSIEAVIKRSLRRLSR